jgi:hypothetical protein
MIATGSCCSAADTESACEFGLSGGGERRAFLMAHADPLDPVLPADRIGERVERVTDDSEHLGHADFGERIDQ